MKRENGVFLTQGDPFGYDAVAEWVDDAVSSIGHGDALRICEPYAGTNSLLSYFDSHYHDRLVKYDVAWSSFDLMPPVDDKNLFASSPIRQTDTLMGLPDKYDIVITNPPYLARNSARRRGFSFPFDHHGIGIERPADLYQIALDTCLSSAKYCAMLIPESFVTSSYDKARLKSVISLPGDLFSDTDCPVCLALFVPYETGGYAIYANDGRLIGMDSEISDVSSMLLGQYNGRISFNIPDGDIGLLGVDGADDKRIRFVVGSAIQSSDIKQSSRVITRISIDGLTAEDDMSAVIDDANQRLNEWRERTGDVLLTAFKGVRRDGMYRRRLSYAVAERLLDRTLSSLGL